MNCPSCGIECELRGVLWTCPKCSAACDAKEPDENTAYLADDVTVGQLMRHVNFQVVKAAREIPPNTERMVELILWADDIEYALASFRKPH